MYVFSINCLISSHYHCQIKLILFLLMNFPYWIVKMLNFRAVLLIIYIYIYIYIYINNIDVLSFNYIDIICHIIVRSSLFYFY